MAKVKFNVKFLDEATGVIYEPSTAFVDVPKHVEKRVKEKIELGLKEYFDLEQKEVKDDKPTNAKTKAKSK